MCVNKFSSHIKILIYLVIIGLFAHFQTLKFGLFGDDWMTIYYYLSQDSVFFGHLPGIFRYFTEYGGVVFITGILYSIFGHNYAYYFLTSLLLKIFAAFSLYLAIERFSEKNVGRFLPFLSAVFLLVGFTGLQTTDYAIQMGVFLSAALSFLSIYFLIIGVQSKSKIAVLYALLTGIFALIISPYRLFSYIFIFPFTVILFYLIYKPRLFFKYIMLVELLWIILVAILIYIGLFAPPGYVLPGTYFSAFNDFTHNITADFSSVIFTIFQWIGVVIFPDALIENKQFYVILGGFFTALTIVSFYFIRKNQKAFLMLLTAFVIFIFYFILMFAYRSKSSMSSPDRYLTMIFYGFCFFFPSLFILLAQSSQKFADRILAAGKFTYVILIVLHFIAIQKMYNIWLDKGRSTKFILETEKVIFKNIKGTINNDKIIYLDFDEAKTLYYIQYGLDFKTLVFTNTLDQKHIPEVYIEMGDVLKKLKKTPPEKRNDIINNTYGFTLRNKILVDDTDKLRENLQNYLKTNHPSGF